MPRKYPDTCIAVNLQEIADYELIYTLNGINYHFEFSWGTEKSIRKKESN